MISYIEGKVLERKPAALLVLAGGLGYEVLVPPAVLAGMSQAEVGQQVSLILYYYLQIDQSRAMPVMIGFRNEQERDFFEQFIQVASIGPRTAVKAIALPIPQIAAAIEAGDLRVLTSLPGIGQQKAKEVVAKLQGKVSAFAMMDGGTAATSPTGMPTPHRDELEDEALAVLLQLQYNRNDAINMLKRALATSPAPATVEEVLELIYRQRG